MALTALIHSHSLSSGTCSPFYGAFLSHLVLMISHVFTKIQRETTSGPENKTTCLLQHEWIKYVCLGSQLEEWSGDTERT